MVRLLMNQPVPARRFDSALAAAKMTAVRRAQRAPPPADLSAKRAAFGGCVHPPRLALRSSWKYGLAAAAKMTHPVGAVVRDDL